MSSERKKTNDNVPAVADGDSLLPIEQQPVEELSAAEQLVPAPKRRIMDFMPIFGRVVCANVGAVTRSYADEADYYSKCLFPTWLLSDKTTTGKLRTRAMFSI